MRDNVIVDSFIPLAENFIHVGNTDIYECIAAFKKAYYERDSRIEIWVSSN